MKDCQHICVVDRMWWEKRKTWLFWMFYYPCSFCKSFFHVSFLLRFVMAIALLWLSSGMLTGALNHMGVIHRPLQFLKQMGMRSWTMRFVRPSYYFSREQVAGSCTVPCHVQVVATLILPIFFVVLSMSPLPFFNDTVDARFGRFNALSPLVSMC